MTHVLDRRYELDLRSLNHRAVARRAVTANPRLRSYTWRCDPHLDQRSEGACVGFGFTHELLARPQVVRLTDATRYARLAYLTARGLDEWEGEAYEGTSVLAGAKVLTADGFYSAYTWAIGATETALCLGRLGPAVLGVNWYTGMFDADPAGFVAPTGAVEGGHCVLAKGVKIVWASLAARLAGGWHNVDKGASYVTLHNSWGPTWGTGGDVRLRLVDLEQLLDVEHGEACLPVRTTLRHA